MFNRQIGPLSSNSAGVSDEDDKEEGALVNGPLETMFKQSIKSASRGGKKKLQIKKEKKSVQPSTSGVKKKPPLSKVPISVSKLSEETSGRRKSGDKHKNEVEGLKPTSGWEDWADGKKNEEKSTIRQRGSGLDFQKLLTKTGIEFHWPGYQFIGPGTKLAKRLKRGDPGINRLDKIAKQHDIDYSDANKLRDKWQADTKMIKAIDKLPGKKTLTEKIVKRIMQAKKKLKL